MTGHAALREQWLDVAGEIGRGACRWGQFGEILGGEGQRRQDTTYQYYKTSCGRSKHTELSQ
jgi:hypothetical protein